MKTKILTITLSFLTLVAIAQKKEIRDAGKAIDKENYAEAKTLLTQAEPNLSEANSNYQADFYLYKGQAYLGSGENIPVADLMTAAEAFKKAQELGSDEAADGMANITNSLVQSAIKDQNAEKYDKASEKLYAGYQLNSKDTLYLYYAASNSVNAGDYDTALKYYEELKGLGYTGIETQYIAVNKETGEEEVMSKIQRDLMVKSGDYLNPEDRIIPSKEGEIAKNIVLIYMEQGKNDKAIAAIDAAKLANPEDISLLQTEADLYYQLGDREKYRTLMEAMVENDPNNPTIYYNLGVTSYEIGNIEAAVKYYNKALELNPKLTEARLNIAAAILSGEAGIVEQMNSLGLSKADTKKYDELAAQRKGLYKEALPYLEKVMENDPENVEAIRTTMNIYYQLGEAEKAAVLQEKLAQNQD